MSTRLLLDKTLKKIDQVHLCLSIYRKGFYFVDIPRTSSSSIRRDLGERFGKIYGKENVIETEHASAQVLKDHIPAREIRSILGKTIWDKIFTFSIVRNPWDRTFSMFNYLKKVKKIPMQLSFRDYVLSFDVSASSMPKYHNKLRRYSASDFVTGENGEIIVDYIAKYESRENDLKYICSRLKIDNLGSVFIQRASPEGRHYSEFYDNETKEIIQDYYAKDIEFFNYEFENIL